MSADTDTNVNSIEHLDFEPTCEARFETCTKTAEYITTGHAHCSTGDRKRLLCGACIDFIIKRRWSCPNCKARDIDGSTLLVAWEPLR